MFCVVSSVIDVSVLLVVPFMIRLQFVIPSSMSVTLYSNIT